MNSILASLSAAASLVLCAAAAAPAPGHLTFHLIEADIGDAGMQETRRVFTTQAEYESYFGLKSPAEVNWEVQWVAFYAAGVQPTGGYRARILDIENTEHGRSLMITTSLESPGPNCIVPEVLTRPYELASFPKPPRRLSVLRFRPMDVQIDCKE